MTTTTLDTLHPAVAAADYLIAGLGREGALLALAALRAGWLAPDEAVRVEPLAVSIGYLLSVPVPKHRGVDATMTVANASVAAKIAEHVR